MNLSLSVTLQSLLEIYFTHRLLRPATLVCYRDAVQSLTKSMGLNAAQIPLRSLAKDDLLKWRMEVLGKCAGTSFNKHRRHVRALLNFAVQEGFIDLSPLSRVSAAPIGKRRPKTVPVTWLRKARELLDADHQRLQPSWFWRAVVDVMFFGMIRRRQLVELTWADVHFRENSITLSSEGSKSRKEWDIPMPKQVMQQLVVIRGKMKEALGREVVPTDQVFCWPLFSNNAACFKKTTMNEEHLSSFFVRLSDVLGYVISSHRVRHTSATIMLARSTDLKGTSQMLGHSTIALTADTYIHPSIAHLRKTQKKMPFYTD